MHSSLMEKRTGIILKFFLDRDSMKNRFYLVCQNFNVFLFIRKESALDRKISIFGILKNNLFLIQLKSGYENDFIPFFLSSFYHIKFIIEYSCRKSWKMAIIAFLFQIRWNRSLKLLER